jgi:NitT/TauT family transport system substrate-binding protein
MFFTSGQLIDSDPGLVQDMTAALEETLEYAEANPDDVKAHVSEFLDLPDAVLDRVSLEAFGPALRRDEIEQLGRLMVEDGLLTKDADVEGLLPQA